MSIDSMMVFLGIPNNRRDEFRKVFDSQVHESMDSMAQAKLARIIWDVMK